MIILDTKENVMNLEDGDIVIIPGYEDQLLEVEKSPFLDDIYLTTLDSRSSEYNRLRHFNRFTVYSDYIKHLRNNGGFAVMTKEKMWEIIESKQFTIG